MFISSTSAVCPSVRLVGNLSKDLGTEKQAEVSIFPRLFFRSWQMAANQMCQPSAVCHLTLVLSPAPEIGGGTGSATGSGSEISRVELRINILICLGLKVIDNCVILIYVAVTSEPPLRSRYELSLYCMYKPGDLRVLKVALGCT